MSIFGAVDIVINCAAVISENNYGKNITINLVSESLIICMFDINISGIGEGQAHRNKIALIAHNSNVIRAN